jgi:alkanesulfonate monooxygenase SsuD/methylene tetrahydromethanopterin reductase-like flavin-dependent oxidoreductase (luciferase family)
MTMMASHAPRIGFMMTAVGAEGDDDAAWYRQLIADAELGASLGFDAGWIVEHHFSDYQPTPNTLLMLSHVAARCPTLGLGTAVIVTPWHHPLRIAEEIAMLSLLTRAPLRIGLGRGNAPLEYEAFGVAMAEAKDRFQECWEIIQLALKGRPFTYQGRYLTIDREITVRPYARNEQITFIGAIGHPTSAEKIGALGLAPLVNGGPGLEVHSGILTQWNEAIRRHGGNTALPRIVSPLTIVADTDEEARALARRYVPRWYQLQLEHYAFDAVKYASVPGYQPFTDGMKRRLTWSNPDNLDSLIDVSFIGSPDTVIAKVRAYLDLGYDYLLLNASTPGMPERWRHDWLTRFARDVRPHLGWQSAAPAAAAVA